MSKKQTRRQFLNTTIGAAVGCSVVRRCNAAFHKPFSFILLGDLHYDKLEHHDFHWLEQHQAGDLSQIKNYSRLTSETMPAMFTAVKARVAALQDTDTPPAFVLQVGDLVEGLCGSEELATRQNREALEFIDQAELGIPFLFTKGNHDVTGDGAINAFGNVLLPFMKEQASRVDRSATNSDANYTLTFNNAQFAFFDAYDKSSLEWLEAIAANRTADNFFLIVHPPVVPYGARATWYVYSDEKSKSKRAKLLEVLGGQEAIVLGGHLHKFSALTRKVGSGRFQQLAVSSVVSALDEIPRDVRKGLDAYNGDQVQLEPKHSPTTEEKRRAIYDVERRNVTEFEYANSAGYAVITVGANRIEASIHAGTRQEVFRRVVLNG